MKQQVITKLRTVGVWRYCDASLFTRSGVHRYQQKTWKQLQDNGKYTSPNRKTLVCNSPKVWNFISSSVLRKECVYCWKEFPLQSLGAHVLTHLSSSLLSYMIQMMLGKKIMLGRCWTNMSTDNSANLENKIKVIIIGEEIIDIIEDCKTKDLNNSVEILKYIQTRLIEDVTHCISGATNIMMLDGSDLMNTRL